MGIAKYAATRLTMSMGVAVLVVLTPVAPMSPVSTASAAVRLAASSAPCTGPDVTCALIMGFTSLPTPDRFYIDAVKNQFITPTHPRRDIEYVAVTTPEEGWPLTGVLRLSCLVLGPPSLCGPGGAAWPDEPLWKLSGLFDLTYDRSIQAGVADLADAMAKHPNEHRVIYGYSQGAIIANHEKRGLAQQYPAGTEAPDIDFVLGGDGNLPNGGIHSRLSGLYIPILDFSFDGPAPTDTQFDTVEINRQYDFYADFPLYPLNVIADLNAFLGFFYVHLYGFDVSLPPDPRKTSAAYQGTYGDTDYYFFETQDLPLFGPLRTLGVPEKLIDVVEPFFRVLVEQGYDRSIPPWKPTPARLLPTLHPKKVATDFVNAVEEGINNALALIGVPPLKSIRSAPDSEGAKSDVSQQTTWAGTHQMTSTLERNPAGGTPVEVDATVEPKTADDPEGNVENPAEVDVTVEPKTADDSEGDVENPAEVDATVEPKTADDINETNSRGTSSGNQQKTSRGTWMTRSETTRPCRTSTGRQQPSHAARLTATPHATRLMATASKSS